jgi:hypothetical protein
MKRAESNDNRLKLRITPRARMICGKLKTATDPRERNILRAQLHEAVGLHPWEEPGLAAVVEYMAEAEGAMSRADHCPTPST